MSSSSYTTTIMSHIKTYEKRSLFISLISRTLIIIVSVTVSLVTAYGVYALFNEGGRFEILQLLSVDAHLLSLYGPEEVIQIVAKFTTASICSPEARYGKMTPASLMPSRLSD